MITIIIIIMGVVSGLAGVVRFFEMMVDVDEWLVYGLDRD